MIDWMMNGLVEWLTDRLQDLLGGLLSYLMSSMFLSPDVTVLPQVQTIAAKSALVVNACYLLALLTAGIVTMTSSSFEMRYGVKEFLPRLVIGFILSNFAVPLCAVLISVANALTVAMVGTAAPTTQAVTMARTHVAAALIDPANALVALIIGLLIVGLMFTLVTGWVVRVAVLVILAGLAPVALACYGLPWTQPTADLWWRSLLGCLGTAVLQAVAFSNGIQLLTDPDASIPVLIGLPSSDVLNLLLVAAVLWMTVKIPGMMRRYTMGRGSPNIGGVLLRAVVIQRITRRLPFGGPGRAALRGGR
ncbi:hypothetical protein DLJ59_19275 [Micromonospora inaquosa]|uniref:Uncharacterized protein n=2 Tax=Micromonospora inaquosa TaxID=2203716 RepID=A0A3N9WJL5_9ACTN|nr:hypothetical protein DLJ59_19275 [Micromonospora inaquosa]